MLVVLDALGEALHERGPAHQGGLMSRGGRGLQDVGIRCTEHLAEAGNEPWVDGVGESDDKALAETINDLDKAGCLSDFYPSSRARTAAIADPCPRTCPASSAGPVW